MADTYTQIYIHAVFAVRDRACLLKGSWKEELHKYITGVVKNYGHKLIAINSMPDHIHVFIGLKPVQSISDLLKQIKESSSKWINKKNYAYGKFNWQAGYGAFSYSYSQIDTVVKYIENQQQHHQRKTFVDEYIEFLKKFNVQYEERFIFKYV